MTAALDRDQEIVVLPGEVDRSPDVGHARRTDHQRRVLVERVVLRTLDDLISRLGSYGPAGYNYIATSFRFNVFVDGAVTNTLVPGSQDSNGAMLRVTITDTAGMSLTSLFYDNNL